MERKTTKLGIAKRGIISGIILLTVSGLGFWAMVSYFTFTVNNYVPIPILVYAAFALPIIFFTWGIYNFIGWYFVTCPYCDKNDFIRRSAHNIKCMHCKKISVRKGDYLETVE